MSKFNDISNKTFGKITAISPTNKRYRGSVVWKCRCSCGKATFVNSGNLVSGSTQSCGCVMKKILKSGNMRRTHGMRRTSIYGIWSGIKDRCLNKNKHNYHRYGGRGITVSPKWMKFENFYRDMGSTYKKGLQIDRKDNNKGYNKKNCRWVTCKQNNNNRIDNIFLEYNGKKMTLSEWSSVTGHSRSLLYSRFYHGWSAKEILTTN